MELGFVSAIFPDLSLDEVIQFASSQDFSCVELMCWPKGKAERRYAGVTHIDVVGLTDASANQVLEVTESAGVSISGLGYYPNPLAPDPDEAQVYIDHLKQVMEAAALLKVNLVNTFIGRDWTLSIDDNWPRFMDAWQPLVKYAADRDVRIGIENCPMLFTQDEWPGGKNLAYCPAVWRRMFEDIPDENFGLNYDPSHLVWQRMDYVTPLFEFADRIFHVHAKDARIDQSKLNDVGILATPLEYHTPKLPGLGNVNWGRFLSALGKIGYDGPLCIEVEDRVYEGSLEDRKAGLHHSARALGRYMV